MYVGVGSSSNVDAGDPEMRAAINRFNPDGSGHEIFASGTRNPTSDPLLSGHRHAVGLDSGARSAG